MDVRGKVGKSIRLSHKAPTASRGTLRGLSLASGHGNIENLSASLQGFQHSHSLQLFFEKSKREKIKKNRKIYSN
jgi:hypothetical protein